MEKLAENDPTYFYLRHVVIVVTAVTTISLMPEKGVLIIRILKKNRQHNDQMKKYKMTNNDLQNIHIKLKIE
jgi:hypothetical protein